jgi:hypothetical protein
MHKYLSLPFVLFVLLCGFSNVLGASNNLRLSVSPSGRIKVEAELSSPMRSWSFRNAYAGILGIADRVEDFRAENVPIKKVASGEFRSDVDATRITYTIKLSDPDAAGVSHLSWLAGDRGFLMFADLIPIDLQTLSAEFNLSPGWTIESSITRQANGQYQVSEPEKAVFFIGSTLRKTTKNVDGMMLDSVLSGTWPFKDEVVLRSAAPVLKKYLSLTGFKLPTRSVIMIAPLPVAVGSVEWRAETRGSTVVLLIDPNAQFRNWRGQLGVIFTHELLHLWVPNSLKLQGDYDWFFEGFTLYTALRTALELKIINFKEFVDTLARVYDSYLSHTDDLSLIEASETRWTTPASFVYDKGMLVAFLYDMMLRKESGGKTTFADRYRELFSRRFADGADGNEAIMSMLGSTPALRDFMKSYVKSSTHLELKELLRSLGYTQRKEHE